MASTTQPAATTPAPDDIITTTDACKARPFLNRHRLRGLRDAGAIPYWKVGPSVYVRLADIDAVTQHIPAALARSDR